MYDIVKQYLNVSDVVNGVVKCLLVDSHNTSDEEDDRVVIRSPEYLLQSFQARKAMRSYLFVSLALASS